MSQKDREVAGDQTINNHSAKTVDSDVAQSFTPVLSKLPRNCPCSYADDAELYSPVKPDKF